MRVVTKFVWFQPTRDATGAAIAVFTANKHFPTQTTHQTTLQVIKLCLELKAFIIF